MRWRRCQRLLRAGVILGHRRCERGSHGVLTTGRLAGVLELLELALLLMLLMVVLGGRRWLRCLGGRLLMLMLMLLLVRELDGVEVADGRQIERGQRHVGSGGRRTVRLGTLARA